jgi:2-methylcitrate dehydratase PrpD
MAEHQQADGLLTRRGVYNARAESSPAVLRQRAKVQLVFDACIERDTEQREAIVEVVLAGGDHLNEHVTVVRGRPENPMSRDEVVAKCAT